MTNKNKWQWQSVTIKLVNSKGKIKTFKMSDMSHEQQQSTFKIMRDIAKKNNAYL
tara:strand:- start:469 stop:633 length:165 start_codon:yes stop_codon:yes gene_type:complete